MQKFFNILIWLMVIFILGVALEQNFQNQVSGKTLIGAFLLLCVALALRKFSQAEASTSPKEAQSFEVELQRLITLSQGTSSGVFQRGILAELITRTNHCMVIARTDTTILEGRRISVLPILGDLKIALERVWTAGIIDGHQEEAERSCTRVRMILASLNT